MNSMGAHKIGVILAGGRSRRMGTDKAVFVYKGRRLIDHVHARLKPQVDEIMISGRLDYGLGLAVISDKDDVPHGPVGGIVSLALTLRETHPQASVFYTVPVDAPMFPDDIVAALSIGVASDRPDYTAIARSASGLQAVFACWQISAVLAAAKTLNHADSISEKSISLQKFAALCGANIVDFDSDVAFLNINEPRDAVHDS